MVNPQDVAAETAATTTMACSSFLLGNGGDDSVRMGVLDLSVVAGAVVLPLTLWKQLYAISLGYGGSVAAMALTIAWQCAANNNTEGSTSALVWTALAAAVTYGIRLSVYLAVREAMGWKPQTNMAQRGKLQRTIPLATGLSLYYASMVSPLLYLVQRPPPTPLSLLGLYSGGNNNNMNSNWRGWLAWTGIAVSWMGVLGQAVADQHKSIVKQRGQHGNDSTKNDSKFVGPSTGLYRICRHPNYLGEILVWLGFWVAGLSTMTSIEHDWAHFAWSTVGFAGIVSIMMGSTKRLEERHAQKYGGQVAYETWRKEVPSALIPFF